ncbi:unnamed protein product [Zymoseptoria tritici ST99CH_1E4]|uniref:Retrotransposon gag domain-containing protein n=1 Tax=Zymoseptoria tritici ST99CH_1E4 TaxID=1276532 RepID=A0A2H1FMJ7_ZYMTR|nr:unnamed protein product [Zymoseptoria tritici ST99CH_1E4]
MLEPRVLSAFDRSETPTSLYFQSLDDMFAWMDTRYAENNRTGKAQNAMTLLKQGEKQSFTDFFREYTLLRAHLTWSPDTELFELKNKLNKRFRVKLADGVRIETPEALVKRCERLEIDLEELDHIHLLARIYGTDTKDRGSKRGGSTKPSSSSRLGRSNASSALVSATANTSRPRVLADKYKNLPRLTDTERTKFRKEGRCFRCREVGHLP